MNHDDRTSTFPAPASYAPEAVSNAAPVLEVTAAPPAPVDAAPPLAAEATPGPAVAEAEPAAPVPALAEVAPEPRLHVAEAPPTEAAPVPEAVPVSEPDAQGVAEAETGAPEPDGPAAETEPQASHEGTTAPEADRPPKPPVDPEVLAARKLRAQQSWDRVVAARESSETLTGSVTAVVKGGVLVDVGGIRGFLPASQVRLAKDAAIETLVKTKLPLKVIDIDQTRRRIVVSHRRALDDERRTKRSELLASLAVGQVREGVVARLADFGAFVDLGGIDGLIPMRELAFERVEKVADVLAPGDTVMVEILRIEEGGKKISLSRKNALPDPWRDHAAVLRPGQTVEGTVVAKEGRLQVEIAPGIVGSVREGDADPADYEIGEKIEVVVRFADRRARRIGLTTLHGAAAVAAMPTSSGFAPLGVELGRRI